MQMNEVPSTSSLWWFLRWPSSVPGPSTVVTSRRDPGQTSTEAVNSRQEVIENVIKNPQDGSVAHNCLQKIRDIIQKNQ